MRLPKAATGSGATTEVASSDACLATPGNSQLIAYLRSIGITDLRIIRGRICGVYPFMFTYGLTTRLDFAGWHARFCYECKYDAQRALELWDGFGDPPGPWIKQKGPVERHNPLLYDMVEPGFHKRNAVTEEECWQLESSKSPTRDWVDPKMFYGDRP